MTEQEFKYKVDELFSGYKIVTNWIHKPNTFFLIKNIVITFSFDDHYFYISEHLSLNDMYMSPKYDDYEQCFDELIIFKELILPKLLEEYGTI